MKHQRLYTLLTAAVATVAAALSLGAAPASAAGHASAARPAGAVFVLTNDLHHNSVIAYDRASNGTLTKVGVTATGGTGAIVDGAVVDPLASQGALTLDSRHKLLFAVNGGSDTVTVFRTNGSRLSHRQILSSHGDLPVSVSVSGNLVYVLNARSGGSITGYRIVGQSVVPLRGSTRSLELVSDSKPEFLQSPAQVAITPNRRAVVITTKTHGTLLSFPLNHAGRPSRHAVTTKSGTVPFALTFDSRGRLQVVDATGFATTYRVGRKGVLTELSSVGPTGEKGACWSVVARGTLYVANAGTNSISAISDKDGQLHIDKAVAAHTDGGPVDLAASRHGRYIYQLSGADGTVETFRVGSNGSLKSLGSVETGLGSAVGSPLEGIAAS